MKKFHMFLREGFIWPFLRYKKEIYGFLFVFSYSYFPTANLFNYFSHATCVWNRFQIRKICLKTSSHIYTVQFRFSIKCNKCRVWLNDWISDPNIRFSHFFCKTRQFPGQYLKGNKGSGSQSNRRDPEQWQTRGCGLVGSSIFGMPHPFKN